jgi:ABC-type nitrate/sulfonate/bicarbonate transport system permease component
MTDAGLAAPGRTGASPALLGVVGLVAFAAILEVAPRVGILPAEYFPPTSTIGRALVDAAGDAAFWTALRQTLRTWAIGLGIAAGAGVLVGVSIGAVPFLRSATASTIEFLRPIPSVALIPLAVVLFDTGVKSTLLLVVYAAFWQVLIQVLAGVADVDPVARETAQSYRLGRWARVRYLVWPTTLPYAVTGFRLAASVALILTVTGELVIPGAAGLGQAINTAQSSNAVPAMYALIVVTGLIGVAANQVTRAAERWVLAWHPSVRGEVVA